MPTSDMTNVAPVMNTVRLICPKHVLDLGIGFGKYGVLVREWTDGINGRVPHSSWKARIVGVEGHVGYRNPAWDLYDRVDVEDFTDPDHWDKYEGHDLVLMIDSLEHVDRSVGDDLLIYLRDHNRNLIVSTPVGFRAQDAVNGNEFERHRSGWTRKDFAQRGAQILHQAACVVAWFRS
jgi:hypothetical protein